MSEFREIERDGVLYNVELDDEGMVLNIKSLDSNMKKNYEAETGRDMVIDVLNDSLNDNIFSYEKLWLEKCILEILRVI